MKKTIALFGALALMVTSLSVTAFAKNFTPSVEQKGSPSISATMVENGKIIRTADGSPAVAVMRGDKVDATGLGKDALTLTSTLDLKNASPEIQKNMKNALTQIGAAKSLKDIAPDIDKVLEDAKQDILKNMLKTNVGSKEIQKMKELKVEDLIVRDLFDVSLDEKLDRELDKDDTSITIGFNLGLKDNEILLVMHNYEADKWEVIDNDLVERTKDGNVYVTFNSLSPIAFVVRAMD